MAEKKMSLFTCPHCKNESEREVLDSINIDLQPEMREQVQDLSCFAWECPVCRSNALVVDPCLYHDMSGQFMVWLSEDGAPPAPAGFGQLAGYTLRLTDSLNAFREKINILEKGLDDRAVEMMKLLLMMQLTKGLDVVDLLFHDLDERTGSFRFAAVLSDGSEQYATMDGQTYIRIKQDVDERLYTSAREFARIDMNWAAGALELLHDA